MRRAVALVSALVLTTVWVPAKAQEEPARRPPIHLDDVIRSVDERFPAVQAAMQERAAALAGVTSTEGAFDPAWRTRATAGLYTYDYRHLETWIDQPTTLWGTTLSAGYRHGSGKFPEYAARRDTNEYGQVFGAVRVPLWRDGPTDDRRARIEQAEMGVDVAGMRVAEQRIEATYVGSLRYWEWVAAGQRRDISRAWLDLARVRDQALGERVLEGDIPAFEQTENARTILQRESALVAAERALEQASIALSIYLRDRDGAPVLADTSSLPEGLPRPRPLDRAIIERDRQLALERRPEILRLERQFEQQEVERRLADNQTKPAVDVQLFAARDIGQGPRSQPIIEASVFVEIPLMTRVADGRGEAAVAEQRRIERMRQLAKDQILAELDDAVSALTAAREPAEVTEREVEVARQLEQLELARFELGESTLLLVNLREQATAEAALRNVDALLDYQRALAAYRAAAARVRER